MRIWTTTPTVATVSDDSRRHGRIAVGRNGARRLCLVLLTVLVAALAVPLATGAAEAAVVDTFDFGSLPIGSTSPTHDVAVSLHGSLSSLPSDGVLYNGGAPTVDLVLAAYGISVPVTVGSLLGQIGDVQVSYVLTGVNGTGDTGSFPVDLTSCLAATAGASCTLGVAFSPGSASPLAATYTPVLGAFSSTAVTGLFQSVASFLSPQISSLVAAQLVAEYTGTGTPALIFPTSLDFGATAISHAKTLDVPVQNVSDTAITLSPGLVYASDTRAPDNSNGPLTVTMHTCATSLPVHSSCILQVTYDPVNTLPIDDDLTLDISGQDAALVTLSGHGVTVLPSADITTVAFPTTPLGEVSAPIVVTITNSGAATANLDITGFSLSPPSAAGDFSVVDGSHCLRAVAPGDSCGVVLEFTPSQVGRRTATFSLVSDETLQSGHPLQVTLIGSAIPAADLSAHLGATSSRATTAGAVAKVVYTVTVTNNGPSSAAGSRVTLTLPDVADFASTNRGSCAKPPIGSTGTLACALGSMASGAVITFKVTVTVPEPTGTRVAASTAVSSPAFDPVAANNSAVRNTAIK